MNFSEKIGNGMASKNIRRDIMVKTKANGYYYTEWLVEIIKLSKNDPNKKKDYQSNEIIFLADNMRQLQSLYDLGYEPKDAYLIIK